VGDDGPAPIEESVFLIEGVLERVVVLVPDDRREAVEAFTRAYLRRLPPDAQASVEELAHQTLGLFAFVDARTQDIEVRVFNPTPETHGYGARGAVVEVAVDDSPFLLDSITNEMVSHGLEVAWVLHPVIGTERGPDGRLLRVRHARHTTSRESVQHYQLTSALPADEGAALERALLSVIGDVRATVRDFHPMVGRIDRMIDLVRVASGHLPDAEIAETIAFLDWLRDDNFVFLGYREYRMFETDEGTAVQMVPGTGLGILADEGRSRLENPVLLSELAADVAARYRGRDLIVITKTNRLATVHRRAKMDYLAVRVFDPDGETSGEARLLGLFTSRAYMERASSVPILRRKLAEIVQAEDLIEGSHDHKTIVQLFEGFSKHDLFAAPTPALQHDLVALLALQEQQRVRLLVRRDLLQRSVSILVALPRDRFNSALRRDLQELFMERFNGTSVEYHLALGDADPAQVHFTVWVEWGSIPEVSIDELEEEVYELARSWKDRLAEVLARTGGEAWARRLVDRWSGRFPEYYTTGTELEVAACDIERLAELEASGEPFLVGIHNERDTSKSDLLTRVVMYRSDGKRPLSELVPALEDMGLEVVEEVPTRLEGEGDYFIHDFGVLGSGRVPLDVEAVGDRIAETLTAVWGGRAESDSLHRLIVEAGLDHHQVAILRAYRTYWRRVRSVFTVVYVNDTLVEHAGVAADLVRLFGLRFDPESTAVGYLDLRASIVARLDEIPSLDQDRILRAFLRMIEATVRTNAFLPDRGALAFKVRSSDVPDVPDPKPFAEIFVIGPEVEGVHLRGGPIARGGIRWSTRREDYRTEVLGLMKAQMTKNAVIVPTGAKGGFVLRNPPTDPGLLREAIAREYEVFIRGLLDVTDDLVDGQVAHPKGVLVHDGPDPYLVVAADKGTATFSDAANRIAAEYGFWLDDAFASGGSTGYDHKALGITARGAWESFERHFREMGIDPATDEFTAVGVGDMSGDVFGNGMLLSDRMKLVAAFDHRHVFVDPEPDPARSFAERRRLFEMPGSSWADYDPAALGPGGGVWPRTAKRIRLPEEAGRVLGTDRLDFAPDELIAVILRAPVDLLWNGGIGTYVKASDESHEEAGDRANDAVRADGSELRCRVVVEGGNLGLTQRGRIEYARAGGRINTDFIDNSGGVDCSDREVNLKILLGEAERRGEIDRAERNAIVAAAADDVVHAILYDNFQQAQIVSQERAASTRRMDAYERLMVVLTESGILDRSLEGLPSSEEMAELARAGRGLSRPELAVLLVDAKRWLKESLVDSGLPDDEVFDTDLLGYFPREVSRRFGHLVPAHPLRRELVSTLLANEIVNAEGAVFVSRLCRQTGAEPADVVRCYRIARDVTGAVAHWEAIEALFGKVDLDTWTELMDRADGLMASLTRWYLGHARRAPLRATAEAGASAFQTLLEGLPECGPEAWRDGIVAGIEELGRLGVPEPVARRHVLAEALLHAPDVLELAVATSRSPVEVMGVMLHVSRAVGLDRLLAGARSVQPSDPWERWGLQTMQDELASVERRLTAAVLADSTLPPPEAVSHFLAERASALARLVRFMRSLGDRPPGELSSLLVATRQIETLID
jgi:glutamate dehydrogenase